MEIYQAVIDAIEAREMIEINGGDDVDNDNSLSPHDHPQSSLNHWQVLRHKE